MGRKKLNVEQIYISFRLRRGRSQEEDQLMDRLNKLVVRSRSRYIRNVLTTGEMDAVLDRALAQETARVKSALDSMGDSLDDE